MLTIYVAFGEGKSSRHFRRSIFLVIGSLFFVSILLFSIEAFMISLLEVFFRKAGTFTIFLSVSRNEE